MFGSVRVFTTIALLATSILAAPLHHQKRIAQVIAEATHDWEQACLKAGGAQKCNPQSQRAFTTLLAAAGNCEQQDAADEMINLAKQLGSDPEMIRLTQLFVQQPRNAPNSVQVPYCTVAPRNSELNGLFHCQFAGSDFTKFSGDGTGQTPLGVNAVSPPGSCPAKPDGPVPDGVQLNTLTSDPFSGRGAPARAQAQAPPAKAPPAQNNAAAAKGFILANGRQAKAQNAHFASLSPKSRCNAGENACVQGSFAQCVGGKFVLTRCGATLTCAALPLVNTQGTSITCTTTADANARIAATGA